MSLEVDGVWAGGVWASTVWGDCVWSEPGCEAEVTPPVTSIGGGGAVSGSQWKRYADIRRKRIIEDNEELLNLCKQAYFDIIKKYFDR